MTAKEFPNSKLKDLKPTRAWAAVSYDTPPEIWAVEWYREHLQSNLRHIRVDMVPVRRKTVKKSKR